MATIPLMAPSFAKHLDGVTPQAMYYPEAAAQTFKRGAPLCFVLSTSAATGSVIECVDAAAVGSTKSHVIGIALSDASGVTGALVGVLVLNDRIVLSMNKKTGATAAADVGKTWQWDLTAAAWTADVLAADNTGGQHGRIIGLDSRDVVGDTNGRLLVVMYNTLTALGVNQ